MIMVRYADDIVVGFQHESDARRFWDATRDRLREFSLALHPDKTRRIEFGRLAAQNCKRRGRSKPETFKFLGFVLICSGRRQRTFPQAAHEPRGFGEAPLWNLRVLFVGRGLACFERLRPRHIE
jgi:hypothetical protein